MTERVSVSSSGGQINHFGAYGGSMSGDGRLVLFMSRSSHLVLGDTNRRTDVFVHNRRTGRTVRVSVADDESQARGESPEAIISADGRFVVFLSLATNLRPNGRRDRNGRIQDVYERDRLLGRTRLVSRNQRGAQATSSSRLLDVSTNGRYVLFSTGSKNFKPLKGPWLFVSAIYLRDMVRHRTYWIPGSVNTGEVLGARVSDNGRLVAYTVISQGRPRRTIVYDRRTHIKHRPTCRVISCQVVNVQDLSPSGRFMVLQAVKTNDEVLLVDRHAHTQSLVTRDQAGGPEDGPSGSGRVTADGRFVLFLSWATDLVAGDTNQHMDLFQRDMHTHKTIRIDLSSKGTQISGLNAGCLSDPGGFYYEGGAPAISQDGRTATFSTAIAGVVPGDTNRLCDVFVRARPPA